VCVWWGRKESACEGVEYAGGGGTRCGERSARVNARKSLPLVHRECDEIGQRCQADPCAVCGGALLTVATLEPHPRLRHLALASWAERRASSALSRLREIGCEEGWLLMWNECQCEWNSKGER
jgi:hypothetical protein